MAISLMMTWMTDEKLHQPSVWRASFFSKSFRIAIWTLFETRRAVASQVVSTH